MSEYKDNTEEESEAPEASAAPAEESKPASQEIANETKSETTSENKAVFGTRKSRPGAAAGSNVKPLSQFRGVFDDDDDEIEMDDLPVRATAPAHLVANDKPARQPRERDEGRERENKRGPRRERERSNDRPRKPRTEKTDGEKPEVKTDAPAKSAEESSKPEKTDDRPERFGTISDDTLEARKNSDVQEFRPSKDGRRAKKTTENRGERPQRRREEKAPEKKGFFAWLKSLFSPEKTEEKPQERRRPRQGKGGQGNQNRRRRRPNNGPRRDGDRPQGENQNRPRGGGERGEGGERRPRQGGNRRRRSGGGNRRPRQEGQERKNTPSE